MLTFIGVYLIATDIVTHTMPARSKLRRKASASRGLTDREPEPAPLLDEREEDLLHGLARPEAQAADVDADVRAARSADSSA